MEPLILESSRTPTAVFVKPQVGYQFEHPTASNDFAFELQDRAAYYQSIHLQTIKFEIAQQVVWKLTEAVGNGAPKLRLQSRHHLFPQVYRLVEEYVRHKIHWRDCHPCELGLATYVERAVERLVDAIESDEAQGESPLLPLLNRYQPMGSTAAVDFKTVRPCYGTVKSHINQVVLDTTWEQSAAFRLEQAAVVACYGPERPP
jgi:type III restriction enzyme